MSQLTFIANPYSVHVAVWLRALDECGIDARIETAARREPETSAAFDLKIDHLAPEWLQPGILRYVWSALAARLRSRSRDEILHAHCTSGNGMIAWLSGHSYIVTTYGSEVLAAADRGPLYQWLIHKVLAGAERITATSPQMVEVLVDQYHIPRDRIYDFDLGLDTETFHPLQASQSQATRAQTGIDADEPVWISVKRAIPMNRTIEIVKAFCRYCDEHSSGRLIVICGDDVSEYSEQVKSIVCDSVHSERIHVLAEWLQPTDVAFWLQLADFAISVPTSDQMSNAVLESMACGAVPMLLEIDGYRSLKERGADVHWMSQCSVQSLEKVFVDTANWSPSDLRRRQNLAVEFINIHYANRQVQSLLQQLYELPQLDAGETLRAA